MRALLLGLALALTPALALADSPADGTQAAKTKKKKKKKKGTAGQNASEQTSLGSLSIDTSMPVTAQPTQEESDDLGIVPLDVEHMLFHRERAELVTRFPAFVESL